MREVFKGPFNSGIICGELDGVNVVGLDVDDPTVVLPESPMVVQTARGHHAYFRLLLGQVVSYAVRVNEPWIDVWGQGGYPSAGNDRIARVEPVASRAAVVVCSGLGEGCGSSFQRSEPW